MSDTELLPKPKREPGSVHRLEVFYRGRAATALDRGAGGDGVGPRSRRRRRWTAEQKARREL
jgi:hypothetical protein